jgi:hypothetical protein
MVFRELIEYMFQFLVAVSFISSILTSVGA